MIRQELYNKTVDILVQAYFNNTLQHSDCYACAVGNMVCANMGYTMIKNEDRPGRDLRWENKNKQTIPYPCSHKGNVIGWGGVIATNFNYPQEIKIREYKGTAKEQIDSTGYSLYDLAKIENAFERANYTSDKSDDDDQEEENMFNGLMAVIDVLDIIHENTDTKATQETKLRFNKKPQTA